jgi:hypothetical protein
MKNKHILAVLFSVISIVSSNAQLSTGEYFYGQDAYRYSNWGLTGSARLQGLGGNYSALGADASNASGNPAGLGFYNRSEISITPFYNSLSTNTTYQDTKTTSLANNNVSVGQASLILHFEGIGTRRRSSALAISYSKQNYLPSLFNYVGTKPKSSLEDYYAELASGTNLKATDLDAFYDGKNGIYSSDAKGNPYSYDAQSAAMAYNLFLIDPTKTGSTVYKRGDPLPTKQSGGSNATGAVSQTNISYGANIDDKIYFGFGLGIAKITYDNVSSHREDFTNGQVFNNFTFTDDISIRGTGLNLSVGGILKATKNLQIGANFISPTWYSMSESYNSNAKVDINKIDKTAPTQLYLDQSDFDYDVRTPIRANFGLTYLFGKSGLITADAEYVGYSAMGVSYTDNTDSFAAEFTARQKRAIQNTYNDVVNFKVGGEFRIDALRLRAGVNYRPDPYKVSEGIDRSQTNFSAGAGYRSSKFFFDVAGVFGQYKSGYTPYELANKANYSSAQINTNMTNIVVSIGTFF